MGYHILQKNTEFELGPTFFDEAVKAVKYKFQADVAAAIDLMIPVVPSRKILQAIAYHYGVNLWFGDDDSSVNSSTCLSRLEFVGAEHDKWVPWSDSHEELVSSFLNAISPYVLKGSFIEFEGSDGSVSRWVFTSQGLEKYDGEVVWRKQEK